jgi:hypothetical protein
LRQSVAYNDEQPPLPDEPVPEDKPDEGAAVPITEYDMDTLEAPRPVVHIKRNASSKRKPMASRLSFGPGEVISGDAAEALEDELSFTPKKSLPKRQVDRKALRKSLPVFSRDRSEEAEEQPTYSKDYLEQLKVSTPSTPKDLRELVPDDADEMELDISEAQGATIVETSETALSRPEEPAGPYIPTDAEIREKKERRARLAKEEDFISLDSGPSDRFSSSQISLLPKKKTETRLVRDDEDLMEGFDEFVDDGRISLGRKAERKAAKEQRKQIAAMIDEAEGSSENDSDDSEAERRAEYEAAQTRAGMDGLQKPAVTAAAAQIPPKITPIPSLTECLAKLQSTLSGMEAEFNKRSWRMQELQKEKADILAREEEVQRLLKEAGERYSALRADAAIAPVLRPVDTSDMESLRRSTSGFFGNVVNMDRGLDSIGNTPIGDGRVEDIG